MINAVVGLALVPILWGVFSLAFWIGDQVRDWWQIRRWHRERL